MPFTAEELEEMRRADEEIEQEFHLTNDDLIREREMEREIALERMLPEKRRIAEYQRAYYEANRDSIAEYQRAYREANRDKYNAYMREYMAKRRKARARLAGAFTEKEELWA